MLWSHWYMACHQISTEQTCKRTKWQQFHMQALMFSVLWASVDVLLVLVK